MKRIVFDGHLKALYPQGIELEGDSAYECMAGLTQYPGFRASDPVRHEVYLPDFSSMDAMQARTRKTVIRVRLGSPGAGGRGMGQILLGALLIGLTIWNPLGAFAGSFAPFFFAGKIGVGLLISGVIKSLMPQPDSPDTKQEQRSLYLGSGQNTVRIGTRIPILLGRFKMGGHYLTFNITATNMPATVTDEPPPTGVSFSSDDYYNPDIAGAGA